MTIRKPPGKRLASLLLSLTLLLTLVPAMGTTAAAANEVPNPAPAANEVSVDGGKCFHTADIGHYENLYYKNGDGMSNFTGTKDNYNAHYDPTTGTLTLNNYNGGYITISNPSGTTSAKDITINLVGSNTVTGSIRNQTHGAITVTGSGSLMVTNESKSGYVYGIVSGLGVSAAKGSVTIKGHAQVTIKTKYTGNEVQDAYGIYARKSITISENASVNITCSTPNTQSKNVSCYGMFVYQSSTDKLTIDTDGDIRVNVSDAGSEAYSYGLYAPNYALTKVGSMEVQWKGTSGVAIYGTGAFDTNTHAVNENESSCYASYRSGTPYKVTVAGGELTGPGVKYERSSGNFLAGDTVKLTASDLHDTTGTVKIPFVKWTSDSDDVTITDPEKQDGASFTVPNGKVDVRANYNPFTVQPKFTYRGLYSSGRAHGEISLTLVSSQFDSQGAPKIYAVGSSKPLSILCETVSGTQKSFEVASDTCLPGEYVVGVSYNNVMCYSEPFKVKYTEPSASVDDVTVSGKAGKAISETSVTITLENDKFANHLPSGGKWIENLPTGLNRDVDRINDTEVKITISGTPLVASTEVMKIIIPAGALVDEISKSVRVDTNSSAKFAITSNAPTADKIQIGDGSNNKFSTEKLYYKNGENGAKGTFSDSSSGWNAHYNPATGTLTLNGYDGPYIWINGGKGQTVTIKTVENNNTVHCNFDPPIQLNDGVNLIITSEKAATLTLDAKTTRGIGSPRSGTERNIGFVQIAGRVTVDVVVSANEDSTYGISVGGDISVLEESSLKITCTSNKSGASNGIMTPGKVTVDTTGTVDIDVSNCGKNVSTYCINAGSIAFKNAEKITLKYVPYVFQDTPFSPTSPSDPTHDTFDVSGMKSPKNTTDEATGVTTVTYAKLGAPPAKPEIRATKYTDLTGPMEVELFCTPGVVIYYTTDDSDPKDSSSTREEYDAAAPFEVTETCTVRAVAYSAEDRLYSEVASRTFTWAKYSISFDGNGKNYSNAYSDNERIKKITKAEPGTTVYLKANETIGGTIASPQKYFSRWEVKSGVGSETVTIENSYSFNGASFTMPDRDVTITSTYTEKPAGVTVSGTAVSWNDKNNAEYYLYPATMSDADIRAQWKTGGTVSDYSYTGTGETISDVTVDKKPMKSQFFRFDSVPAGTYKLVIFKPEKYVPKIVEITVESTALDLGQQKLWLYGDVTYDGMVDGTDALQIKRYYASIPSVFTLGTAEDQADRLLAGNVTGPVANDTAVDGTDALQIKRYYADHPSVFDFIE